MLGMSVLTLVGAQPHPLQLLGWVLTGTELIGEELFEHEWLHKTAPPLAQLVPT